jgi:Fis family transcriptional regulator, factor for inversion stimulation protein
MNTMNDNDTVLYTVEQNTEAPSASASDYSLRQHLITSSDQQSHTLRDNVDKALRNYFSHLDGQPVTDVYDMVLSEIEAPLLETVMEYTRSNQTKASLLLGLNRGTLRKKLKQYGLI